MSFATKVAVISLAVTGASAARSQARRASEHQRRGQGFHSGVNQRVGSASDTKDSTSDSTNWSGAVLEGTNWETVQATITVPTIKVSSGGKNYDDAAWVGIDGDTCQTGLWQTGISWEIDGNTIDYGAWYEWIPASPVYWGTSKFPVSAGDVVTMTITATSKTAGTATLENQTTGKKVSKTTTASATGGGTLCRKDAEWIVESAAGTPANWGSIVFSNATATTASGTTSGPANADIVVLVNSNNKALTKTTTTSTSVTDTYTG